MYYGEPNHITTNYPKKQLSHIVRIPSTHMPPPNVQNGPNLPSNLKPCLLLPITIKYDRSMTMEIVAWLDYSAYVCFINKELVRRRTIILMKKSMPIAMEVIDGQSFPPRPMMHETKALNIIIEMHTSKVTFNVISSLTNPIVIGLSWLILHNPRVD